AGRTRRTRAGSRARCPSAPRPARRSVRASRPRGRRGRGPRHRGGRPRARACRRRAAPPGSARRRAYERPSRNSPPTLWRAPAPRVRRTVRGTRIREAHGGTGMTTSRLTTTTRRSTTAGNDEPSIEVHGEATTPRPDPTAGTSTILDLFDRAVAGRGSAVALRHRDERGRWHAITWGDYGTAVDEVAAGLHALGVRAGDRVGILAFNRYEWHEADFGIL